MRAAEFGRPNNPLRRCEFVLILVVLALVPAACSGESSAQGKPQVLTTFTVLADIADVVGGDLVEVESITTPGAEIHEYDPTPGDLRRGAGADLILDNGLGLERWFEDFVGRIDAPHVIVSEGIDTVPITAGSYEGDANPHAWMSPLNVIIYAENIAAAFGELDPENAATYERNAAAYAEELRAVHDELVAAVRRLPERQRALVTCEGAFSYLARDAGLSEAYLWPVNSDDEGTPQQIARTITFVRDNDVPAVFCETTVSDDPQQQVAREAGVDVAGTLYVDSLSEPDGPVPTYLDLIRHDIETIIEGLTR